MEAVCVLTAGLEGEMVCVCVVYVFVCVCMCVFMCVCVLVYVCVHVYLCVQVCEYVCVYVFIVCVCVWVVCACGMCTCCVCMCGWCMHVVCVCVWLSQLLFTLFHHWVCSSPGPPTHWAFSASATTGLQGCATTSDFYIGPWSLSSVLKLARQTLCQLSSLTGLRKDMLTIRRRQPTNSVVFTDFRWYFQVNTNQKYLNSAAENSLLELLESWEVFSSKPFIHGCADIWGAEIDIFLGSGLLSRELFPRS